MTVHFSIANIDSDGRVWQLVLNGYDDDDDDDDDWLWSINIHSSCLLKYTRTHTTLTCTDLVYALLS